MAQTGAISDYSQGGGLNQAPSSIHDDSMQETSCKASQKRTSKSPLNISSISARTRSGPRIAEVKALNEQLKTMQEKKQADVNAKRYNENLVLRNFKKEFDSIMNDVGLGPV